MDSAKTNQVLCAIIGFNACSLARGDRLHLSRVAVLRLALDFYHCDSLHRGWSLYIQIVNDVRVFIAILLQYNSLYMLSM